MQIPLKPCILLGLLACSDAAFAQRVYGKIGEKYAALGGAGGALGAATNDESPAPYNGRFNSFRNGFIYWHPELATAFGVWGAIGVKWDQLGRVQFGYPITDELGTPDGRGRFNHFRAVHMAGKPEASIYWTPQTGPFAVYGEIRKAWAAAGWERSIGYPTSDEFPWGKYRRSNFEQGYITWAPGEGARIVGSGEAILRQSTPGTFGTILITGIELAAEGKPFAGNSTLLSENTLCAEYDRRRGEIGETLKNAIRSIANPRMRGFSIRSDARMTMSSACSMRADVVSMGDNKIRVRMLLPGNSLNFHVTTPSVIGGWADPEFSMTADAMAETILTAPTSPGGTFAVGPTRLMLSGVRLDSHNITGDIALAVKEAYQTFTGNDLTAQLTQTRVFSLKTLEVGISDLNPAIRRIPSQFRVEYTVAAGNQFRINGTGQPAPRPPVIH